jgi:hypothetical protein
VALDTFNGAYLAGFKQVVTITPYFKIYHLINVGHNAITHQLFDNFNSADMYRMTSSLTPIESGISIVFAFFTTVRAPAAGVPTLPVSTTTLLLPGYRQTTFPQHI